MDKPNVFSSNLTGEAAGQPAPGVSTPELSTRLTDAERPGPSSESGRSAPAVLPLPSCTITRGMPTSALGEALF